MSRITIYHIKLACSLVSLTALEQCELDYDDVVINLAAGEQHSPEYRKINPRGKVPALVVDGQLLSENAAIIWWLARRFPDAGLFPPANGPLQEVRHLADLFMISSQFHPSVRAMMAPMRWTTGDHGPVRERGRQLVEPFVRRFDQDMSDRSWWFGQDWSILDVYMYWIYTTAEKGGYDLSGLDSLAAHRERVEAWPAFVRASRREAAAMARMN